MFEDVLQVDLPNQYVRDIQVALKESYLLLVSADDTKYAHFVIHYGSDGKLIGKYYFKEVTRTMLVFSPEKDKVLVPSVKAKKFAIIDLVNQVVNYSSFNFIDNAYVELYFFKETNLTCVR